MSKLCVGTHEIKIKDAIRQVHRNIDELQKKLGLTFLEGAASDQMCNFYENKIKYQQIALEWLSRAL